MGLPAPSPETQPASRLALVPNLHAVVIRLDAATLCRRLLFSLIGIEVFLVLLDITLNYNAWIPSAPLRRLSNMAREDSLAAWLASVQTFCTGAVLAALAWMARARGAKLSVVRGWIALSAFFFYLGADDGAGIHERVGSAMKSIAPDLGFPTYTWHLVYGPLFGGMALFMIYFLSRHLESRHLRIWFAAALGCYVTAVGLDFIEGLSGEFSYAALAQALNLETGFVNHFGRVTEEFLEIFGTSLFLFTFLKLLLAGVDSALLSLRSKP